MIRSFMRSAGAYLEALRLTNKLNLWPFYLVPGLISLVLALVIGVLVWTFAGDIGGWLTGWYPENWWGGGLMKGAGAFISGLGIIAIGLVLYKTLVIALAGPFMGPLSEKVEQYMTGKTQKAKFSVQQSTRSLVRGVRIALRNVIRELGYTLLLLPFSFIPVTPVLIFLVQSYYAGFGNMDLTLDRHYGVRDSVVFVRRNRGSALGNGAVFVGILFLGVGFLVAPTLGAIAATIESVRRLYPEDALVKI